MSTVFASRITSLRKERNMSQKEVALSLGISQALLSHYEKGVRECGLDFVLKCADFYGVTTDYLLGRQNSKYGLRFNFENPETVNSIEHAEVLDMQTVLLCASYLSEKFVITDPILGDKMLWSYALTQYKILVTALQSGRLNPKAFTYSCRYNDTMFQQVVDGIWNSMFRRRQALSYDYNSGAETIPHFMNMLMESVESYVCEIVKDHISTSVK
ncbi:MAG TPA: hypothetical protein DDY98_08025 [Ruminococcaceae bacterium]|nr:hypothetical protein [Oscillospiraceae bacterium]